MMLAGHVFPPFKDRCIGEVDGAPCRKHIIDLMSVTRDDVGKTGIAHTGCLTEYEFNQIVEYKERLVAAAKG